MDPSTAGGGQQQQRGQQPVYDVRQGGHYGTFPPICFINCIAWQAYRAIGLSLSLDDYPSLTPRCLFALYSGALNGDDRDDQWLIEIYHSGASAAVRSKHLFHPIMRPQADLCSYQRLDTSLKTIYIQDHGQM